MSELCSSALCPRRNSRGGRFYNPHRSSRSLRSAPAGPGHAPWSAPAAETLPEGGGPAQGGSRGWVPPPRWLVRPSRPTGSAGTVPLTSSAPRALPNLPPPRHSAQPRPPASSAARPQPGTHKTRGRKGLTSSRFSNILEPEPSGKHLDREKKHLVRQDQHIGVSHELCIPPDTSAALPDTLSPQSPRNREDVFKSSSPQGREHPALTSHVLLRQRDLLGSRWDMLESVV